MSDGRLLKCTSQRILWSLQNSMNELQPGQNDGVQQDSSTIELVGKGCFPDQPDSRDFKAATIMAAPFVDWSKPFLLPAPPSNDQNGSSSCVAQAWSYYHWQLRGKDYSRRDIYAQIALPQGGAYIRDGGLQIVNFGQATRDETPDPVPETESDMKDKTGISTTAEASDQEYNSFLVPFDIDNVATAIGQYNGVVFGVTGSNNGWHAEVVRPPLPGEVTWGHALYLYGYHLHDGKKCVIARSSWSFIADHHIQEDYFTNNGQWVFNPWTLIKKQEQYMEFLKNHQNWLVQNSDTGAFGLVKGDSLLVCTPDRAGLLALTLFQRKAKDSIEITSAVWDNLSHAQF